MKILIFTVKDGPSLEELQQVAKQQGDQVDVVRSDNVEITTFHTSDFISRLLTYDLVYFRGGLHPALLTEVKEILDKKGIPLINDGRMYALQASKLEIALMAGKHGIPHPKTVQSRSLDFEYISQHVGLPFVAKPDKGAHGNHIVKITSQDEFEKHRASLKERSFIFQSFLTSTEEYRVYTFGGVGVAAYKKVPMWETDEFRMNSNYGTKERPIEQEKLEELLKFAGVIGKAFKLDISGIDIVDTEQGLQLLEVNGQPRWVGLEEAIDVNMSERVLEYLRGRKKAKWWKKFL